MSPAPRPFTLVAEVTHRCPLHCPYCSNPLSLTPRGDELTTAEWGRVFAEAEQLGIVQLHLTGGEPLARGDLEELTARARASGMYTQLVTSGVPLERARLAALQEAGLDAVQLSLQGASAAAADPIAGYPAHAAKRQVAAWVKELGLPLTINVVLHRENLDSTAELIALAEELRADRLELANAQYHGWALANRGALLPTPEQLDRAAAIARGAAERLRGKMEVLFVKPDYFEARPRACMDGWARRFVVVAPDGRVFPCQSASTITSLKWETVRQHPLGWIWSESPSMNAYRGEGWMPEPCRSCDRRSVDHGGCRCQAFQLAGDAGLTNPACELSPHHGRVGAARREARPKDFLPRGR